MPEENHRNPETPWKNFSMCFSFCLIYFPKTETDYVVTFGGIKIPNILSKSFGYTPIILTFLFGQEFLCWYKFLLISIYIAKLNFKSIDSFRIGLFKNECAKRMYIWELFKRNSIQHF
mgnify:CR=1 FL=1